MPNGKKLTRGRKKKGQTEKKIDSEKNDIFNNDARYNNNGILKKNNFEKEIQIDLCVEESEEDISQEKSIKKLKVEISDLNTSTQNDNNNRNNNNNNNEKHLNKNNNNNHQSSNSLIVSKNILNNNTHLKPTTKPQEPIIEQNLINNNNNNNYNIDSEMLEDPNSVFEYLCAKNGTEETLKKLYSIPSLANDLSEYSPDWKRKHNDMLLPQETWIEIVSYLSDLKSLTSYSRTCKTFYEASRSLEGLNFSNDLPSKNFECTCPSEKMLHFLKSFKRLKRICLAGMKKLSDETIEQIIKLNPQLAELNLESCTVNDDLISKILEYCKNLHSIELDGTRITSNSVKKLVENLPLLKKLIIAPKFCQDSTVDLISQCNLEELGWITISDKTMKTLGQKCQKLRKVYLSGQESTCEPSSIEFFFRFCKDIEHISMYKLKEQQQECLHALSKTAQNLITLEMHTCELSDNTITHFASRSPNLSVLKLDGVTQLTDNGLFTLILRTRLKLIRLDNCSQFRNPFSSIQNYDDMYFEISEIYLQDCNRIETAFIQKIFHTCPNLLALNLCGCNDVSDDALKTLYDIKHTSYLQSISLSDKISDIGIEYLAEKCPNLKEIFAGDENNITPKVLRKLLTHCSRIKTIIFLSITPNEETQLLKDEFPYVDIELSQKKDNDFTNPSLDYFEYD